MTQKNDHLLVNYEAVLLNAVLKDVELRRNIGKGHFIV